MKNIKKRDSSPQISSIVNMLWPQFDNENTGMLDKIEALNFTNEVLIMKGKRKMQSTFQFNQLFEQYDVDGEGVPMKDIVTLVETIIEESNSSSSVNKKDGYLRGDASSLI